MPRSPQAAALAAGLAVAAPQIADARGVCAPRDRVVERLATAHDEVPIGAGLQSGSRLIEIWRSPETGSWTVLLTRADGMSCILAAGEHWRKGDPDQAPKGVEG
jgi:hypothetical protein